MEGLRTHTSRRLNLGFATASLWSVVSAISAIASTSAGVPKDMSLLHAFTVFGKTFPDLRSLRLQIGVLLVHMTVAALCMATWRRSVGVASVWRVLSGVWFSVLDRCAAVAGRTEGDFDSEWDGGGSPSLVNEYGILALSLGMHAASSICGLHLQGDPTMIFSQAVAHL